MTRLQGTVVIADVSPRGLCIMRRYKNFTKLCPFLRVGGGGANSCANLVQYVKVGYCDGVAQL